MSEEKITVLLVEDDPDYRYLAREILTEADGIEITVDIAEDLASTLHYLKDAKPDAVLLDLGLPDSFGHDTLKAVREQVPHVPVVVLTSLDSPEAGIKAVHAGAQDYLVKGKANDEMVVRSLRYAVERGRLEAELEKALSDLHRQFESVANVQEQLLPVGVPEMPGIDSATFYRPAKRAGGDYFDFFRIDDTKLAVLEADVSGHGAHAAVLMAMTRMLAHTLGPNEQPAEWLKEMNEKLAANIPRGQFVAAFYGILDTGECALSYSRSGGLPAPLLLTPGGRLTDCLASDVRIPLGVVGGTEYPAGTEHLEPGSILVVCTDGVTEAQNEEGEPFTRDVLKKVVAKQEGKDPQEVLEAILNALRAHSDFHRIKDDITLLVFKIGEGECKPDGG